MLKMKSIMKQIYLGIAATTFKEWFEYYKKDFNRKQYSKNTELLKDIWSLIICYNLVWRNDTF